MKPLALTVISVVLMTLFTSPVHAYFTTVVSSTENQLSAGRLEIAVDTVTASGSAQVEGAYRYWVAVRNEQSASSAAGLPFQFRSQLSNGRWTAGPHLDGDVLTATDSSAITCPATPAAADAGLVTIQNIHRYASDECEGDGSCQSLATNLTSQGWSTVPVLTAADHGQNTPLSGYYYGSSTGSQTGYPSDGNPLTVAKGQYVLYRLDAVVSPAASDCYQGATYQFDWSTEATQTTAPWAEWQAYFYGQASLANLSLQVPETAVVEAQSLAIGGRADQWQAVEEDLQLTTLDVPAGDGQARQANLQYKLTAAKTTTKQRESAMMVFVGNQLIKEVWANDADGQWQTAVFPLPDQAATTLTVVWYDRSLNQADTLEVSDLMVQPVIANQPVIPPQPQPSLTSSSSSILNPHVTVTQSDATHLDITLRDVGAYQKIAYTLTYQHVVDGQVVTDALTGEKQFAAGTSQLVVDQLYLGTCSTLQISCVPHQQVTGLKAVVILSGPGVPDRTIETTLTQP